jgi:hypothetical protein
MVEDGQGWKEGIVGGGLFVKAAELLFAGSKSE